MLIAATTSEEGRRTLITGLEDENVRRLLNDDPIYQDLRVPGVPGLEDWNISGSRGYCSLRSPLPEGVTAMDPNGHIYMLTDDDREALRQPFAEAVDAEKVVELREDVSRLDGYLRARAEADAELRAKVKT